MSYAYFNELWLITRDDLEKLLELDRKLQERKKSNDKQQGLSFMIPTYLRYRNLVKRLIVCHDQMVQSQKRELIKRVLDYSIGRMLEYKEEIVKLNCYDYIWPDDVLNQFKYTPDDVQLLVSAIGKDVIQQRSQYFENLMEQAHKVQEEVVSETGSNESHESEVKVRRRRVQKKPSPEEELPAILQEPPEVVAAREAREAAQRALTEAVLLIQSHERARKGRRYGLQAQGAHNYGKKVNAGEIVPKKLNKLTYINAAKKIQRAWKRYLVKKRRNTRLHRIEELLDMTIPSWVSNEVFEKDEANFMKRLEMMPLSVDRVAKNTTDTRTRLFKIRGPGLIEDITDEIREWFIIWYDTVEQYYVYPAEHLGGSVLIATEETITPQEYLAQKSEKKDVKDKGSKKDSAKKSKINTWMPESKALPLLDEANEDFIKDWSFRDDSNGQLPQEQVYEDLIKDKICLDLQLEMRSIVDELMRLELKKLNTALTKDYKADKRKLDKVKDKSKKKKGKKEKKKKGLDKIPVEELFYELARAEIIKTYPTASLKDWLGDLSYQNYEAQLEFRDYTYRMGEVKQVVMEYCILPLTSKETHQVAPLTKSVCICGLPSHGKTFLVNAICSQVGALLFDMSPATLVGKYKGKKEERRLIDVIAKVAREYAPSIIFIDNGDRPWSKKIPPEEKELQPKRFARHFPKLVKGIKRGDQILFLTTSSEPYNAGGPFVKIHDKFIIIPLTDYNTLYMFYKDLLMKYHEIDRNIDISCLAKMSAGIPLEVIRNAVETVLNVRRRVTLKIKPLSPLEILEELSKYEPPNPKLLQKFLDFESRTPLGKKRAKLLADEKKLRERLQKG